MSVLMNPCNNFLITHLLQLRQKQSQTPQNRSYRRGYDHQYHLYTRAIQSIKKYPLPIICHQQLLNLVGVGDGLAEKLVPVIRAWYRMYLKGQGEGKQKERQKGKEKGREKGNVGVDIEKGMLGNQYGQGQKVLNWKPSSSNSSMHSQDQQQDIQQNQDKMQTMPMRTQSQKQQKSQSISSKQYSYKPRKGTGGALALKAMMNLNAGEKSVTKKDIDKYLLMNNFDKMKQWKNIKENLVSNGFIEADPSSEGESFFITPKGLDFANETQSHQQSNLTKKKIATQITSFKQTLPPTPLIPSPTPYIPQPLTIPTPPPTLTLLIDTRQMKDQSQRTYFQETLTQKYKIPVETHVLALGDFVFSCGGSLLDVVVERKRADDLAASIVDHRYKEQKWRLKMAGIGMVVYLYEGHPSESAAIKQKDLMTALHRTRVDGFQIIKTNRPSDTVRYLSNLYQLLLKKLQQGQPLLSLGSVEQYNHRNSKNSYKTIGSTFGLAMKTLPAVGSQTVGNLMRYFGGFSDLYRCLAKYQNNEQRIQFLNGLLKGGRTQSGVTKIIVQLLFHTVQQPYDQDNFASNSQTISQSNSKSQSNSQKQLGKKNRIVIQ